MAILTALLGVSTDCMRPRTAKLCATIVTLTTLLNAIPPLYVSILRVVLACAQLCASTDAD